MGQKLAPRIWRSGPYKPTAPRSGNEGDSTGWRKSNLITRGRDGRYYEEIYSGERDLNQNFNLVAITGTVAITNGSANIVGSGTLFQSELHLGQKLSLIDGSNSVNYPVVIRSITDDTHAVVWDAQTSTASTLTGWRMHRMYAVNDLPGVSLTGNVLRLDRGSYLGVGSGEFYLNGSTLTGTSLTLTRKPTLALYDPATGNYIPYILGMGQPDPPSLAAVGGGTKDMQAGNYSVVVARGRKETGGYNNPSLRADVTISTSDKIQITFGAMDTASGQNAWPVWVTTYTDTLGADLNYLNGPWKYYVLVDDTMVDPAGGTFDVEYYDSEVEFNELASFNNDPPPDAEFVEFINAIPVYLSCQGPGTVANPDGTSPGPFLVPSKPNNIEAAPLELAFGTSPTDTILGVVSAQGRLYLLTYKYLQIAQSTPSDVVPIITRPFWHDGFANADQLVFVNGTLYGFPVAGPSRSIGDGDVIEAERNWAEDVAEIILGTLTTNGWNVGDVLMKYDPWNDMVVCINSADHLNGAGYWTTRMLGFGISQNFWVFDGLISSDAHDCIVSGGDTVGDRLLLLIGGRQHGAVPSIGTFVFDDGDGNEWYLAPQITDSGIEQRDKCVKSFRVTGKLTNPQYAIYGYGPTENIDVDAIEAGTGSRTGLKSLPSTTTVVQSARVQLNVPNCMTHTVRISGTWDGVGQKDRIDEICVEVAEQGIRR